MKRALTDALTEDMLPPAETPDDADYRRIIALLQQARQTREEAADRTVRFRYFEYTVSKERRFRRSGKVYEASPFALLWDNENYYLLAWDDEAGLLKHYRVDKMADIARTDEPRRGKEAFAKVDMSEYSKHVFGMFGGQPEQVRLRFAGHLAGAVLDRFGRDLILVPEPDGRFTVSVLAQVSPQFFAWVFGFGDEAEILSPPSVREAFRAQTEAVAKCYAT